MALNLRTLTCILLGLHTVLAALFEGDEYRKNCIECIGRGYKFCGNWVFGFARPAVCAPSIAPSACRTPIADTPAMCSDGEINPDHYGVKTPLSVFDTSCNKDIFLRYDNPQELVINTHNVKKDRLCLIKINNLSGRTHRLSIMPKQTSPELYLFLLNNTDQIYWKTIKNMEDPITGSNEPGAVARETPFEVDVISGTGVGVYAMNFIDNEEVINFETKIVRSAATRLAQATAVGVAIVTTLLSYN